MAELVATEITKLEPVGDRVQKTFEFSGAGVGAADEWIATGLSFIDAVISVVPYDTTPYASEPTVVRNAQGTGVAEDTNPGDLGLEVSGAGVTTHVTVIGRP